MAARVGVSIHGMRGRKVLRALAGRRRVRASCGHAVVDE
jgi:hypothetical protein